MKIYLHFSDPTYNAPDTLGRQGHSLNLDAPQQPSSTLKPFKPISIEPPLNSCSSCSIPTTTKVPPPALPPQFSTQNQGFPNSGDTLFPVQNGINTQIQQNGNGPQNPSSFQDNVNGPGSQPPGFLQQGEIAANEPHKELQAPVQEQAQIPQTQENPLGSTLFNNPSQTPQIASRFGGVGTNNPQQNPISQNFGPQTPSEQETLPGSRTPKRLEDNVPQLVAQEPQNNLPVGQNFGGTGKVPPTKPVLISAQMQIVDKNTDIYKRGPGEKEGLPNGLNKNDMTNLLYTFNYTVGFHGHFEEGYTNGAKQGYYFVTGRNGIRTRIDYVADENGFRPKISQEVLDLLSDEVPKEETERDAKYGLKGYEFKWLYYPIESKGR